METLRKWQYIFHTWHNCFWRVTRARIQPGTRPLGKHLAPLMQLLRIVIPSSRYSIKFKLAMCERLFVILVVVNRNSDDNNKEMK